MKNNGNGFCNGRGRTWTLEEIDFLYEQKSYGHTFAEIAKSLNRSDSSVSHKWKDYNWTAYEDGLVEDDLTIKAPRNHWTDEEEAYLYNSRLTSTPYSVIARSLGRSGLACRKKYNNTDWEAKGYTYTTSALNKKRDIKNFRLNTENTVNRSLDKFRLRADVLADALSDSARNLPKCPLVKWKPRNRKWQDHSPEDMGLILSDLHIGHEHSLEETGGISQYNVDIYKQRMTNLKHAVADIYELHSSLYKIPKLNIFCIGDIVAGMNDAGAWSHVYITTPMTDQVMEGFRTLSDSIWYWLSIFEEIEFFGIRGNHGRCLSMDERILTPCGFKNYDEIEVGDLVGTLSSNGSA